MTMLRRRTTLAAAFAAALAVTLPVTGAAAAWPERPITLIIPWGAGGGTDGTGRILAKLMEDRLGQPINVVNRTGGGSTIGHGEIARAKPDGYTLGIITTELSMFHWLGQSTLSHTDYTLIGLFNADPSSIHVNAASPHKDLKSLAEAIKANPRSIKAGGANQGGVNHLSYVGLVQAVGAAGDQAFWIPSEGAAPALQLLASGAIDAAVVQMSETRSLADAGKIRPLAVMGARRDPNFPDVPTVKEAIGIDFTATGWRGLGGPKDLPAEVTAKLASVMEAVVSSAEFKEFMGKRLYGVEWKGPVDFRAFLAERDASFGAAMKAAGLAK